MSTLMLRHEPKMILQVQSHHRSARGQLTTCGQFVVSDEQRALTKQTVASTEEPAELLISITAKMWVAQLRANKGPPHTPFPTPHFSGSQCAMSVVSVEWTL